MTRLEFPLLAILIASSAPLFIACGDTGYKGPLLPGTSGASGMSTSVGGAIGSSAGQSGNVGGAAVGGATGGDSSLAGGGTSSGGSSMGGSGGSSGSNSSAGSSGSAGANAGGSGGMSTVEQSPIPMDMLQHKWRYTHTCKFLSGQPISNFPTCSEGNNDICWETDNSQRWFDPSPPVWKFGGDPDKVYAIKIRLRAISEPKTLKNCKEVNPRTDNGKHPMVCDGTGQNVTNPGENFNILNFHLNDPVQDFYMNMAEIDEPHRVEKLDEVFTIKARGQSTATFLFDDLNGGEIRNCNKYTFPGMPEVTPYDNTGIDGQFWQWDCADSAGGDACWTVVP